MRIGVCISVVCKDVGFLLCLGVLVEAEHNPQMMCYALGALDIYDGIYDIKTVKMTIFQPRRNNVSTCTMDKEALLTWADTVLAPIAKLAYAGEGEFKAGDHCTLCKIRATCRKRAEYNLELAKYDFEMPANLKDTEIAAILPRVDDLVSWVNDIKEYALQKALSGTKYDGYKVVEGKSNRKYTDKVAVASAVTNAGFDPYEKKLLGITGVNTIWSYANVWDPKAIDGGKPKYSVSLIIPKDDEVTINKIKAAIQAAYEEGQSKLKGNGKSVPPLSAIKNPLRDGDIEKPDDEAYAGAYFVNANSATAPGVVDADRQPIIERSEV